MGLHTFSDTTIKLSLLVWYSAIKATVCVVMCETLLTDI